MIKETLGVVALGAAIFGAPAAANAAEASTVTTAGQTVVAGCDDWCGHGHYRHHHYRHHHGHHGHYRHYGHYGHGYWPGYSFNYSGNQYGGISFRID